MDEFTYKLKDNVVNPPDCLTQNIEMIWSKYDTFKKGFIDKNQTYELIHEFINGKPIPVNFDDSSDDDY